MPVEFVVNDSGAPKTFAVDEADQMVDWLSAALDATHRRSLLIYIHGRDFKLFQGGRDGEPKSSFSEGIVSELETSGSAVVAMIHWPHKCLAFGYPGGYPSADAYDAAPALSALVSAIRNKLATLQNKPSVVLVTHSMGSLVAERAFATAPQGTWDALTSVVISASASFVRGSRKWIEESGRPTFICFNPDDRILPDIEEFSHQYLGQQLDAEFPRSELAANGRYVSVGPLTLNHRYFVGAGSGSNPNDLHLIRDLFFQPLYRGGVPDFTKFARLDATAPLYAARRK